MRKIGIKKTKWNIFLLFVIGLLIGVVMGLRQPVSETPKSAQSSVVQPVPAEVTK